MNLHHVDHGSEKPVSKESLTEPRQTWGQHLADLIERYCETREVAALYAGRSEKIGIAKRELIEGLDEFARSIPRTLDDIV